MQRRGPAGASATPLAALGHRAECMGRTNVMIPIRAIAMCAAACATVACGGGGGSGPTGGGPRPVASIQIDGVRSTFLAGESDRFTALPLDASGNPVTGAATATWASAASSVATVDADGTVRAVGTGSTSINATIGAVNASRVVTVLPPGAGAVVTMPGLTFAPFTVTISRGQAVFFDFPSLAHNVIFVQKFGVPADIQVAAGVTVSRAFGSTGTFPYDCTIHNGMNGEVVVVP